MLLPSCWLLTKLKYDRKSLFNRLTIIPQQDKKKYKTNTKKVRRVVSNPYSFVDIINHAAGVENGALDSFFFIVSVAFHTNNLFESNPYIPISLYCQNLWITLCRDLKNLTGQLANCCFGPKSAICLK